MTIFREDCMYSWNIPLVSLVFIIPAQFCQFFLFLIHRFLLALGRCFKPPWKQMQDSLPWVPLPFSILQCDPHLQTVACAQPFLFSYASILGYPLLILTNSCHCPAKHVIAANWFKRSFSKVIWILSRIPWSWINSEFYWPLKGPA